jgi:hypothetical protein
MGVSYVLYRVRRAPGAPGAGIDDLESLTKGLDFGPLDALKRRLFDAGVYGIDPADPEARARAFRWGPRPSLSGGARFGENLQIRSEDGRFIDMSLSGDPVENIAFDHVAPRDVLPVVDALAELRPFAVLVLSGEVRLVDPETFRPTPPRPCADPLRPAARVPFPSSEGLVWTLEGPPGLECCPAMQVLDGRAFIPSANAVTAVDVATGAPLWSRSWTSGAMYVTPAPTAVVLAGDHPEVYGLSPATGEILWSLAITGRVTANPTRLPDGRVAFGTEAGRVYAVDAASGALLWYADWLPGPVYSPLSISPGTVIATADDGRLGVVYAFADPPDGRPPAVHHLEGRMLNRLTYGVPSLESTVAGGALFVMSQWDVVRLSLPRLDEPITVAEYAWATGFEKFLVPLGGGRLLAYAVPAGSGSGVVRVVDAASLRSRYELPLGHTPSAAVSVGESRWACVLRPCREDPEAEGAIIVLDTASGSVARTMPLGFRGWQGASVAAGDGVLLGVATYERGGRGRGRDGWSAVGCWRVG